jgi:hypothetical protein
MVRPRPVRVCGARVHFMEEAKQHRLLYTLDGGMHWRSQALPGSVYNCQVFNGGLLCSSAPGFHILDVHPR